MLAVLRSAALVGVEAVPVEVEVNTGEQGDLRIEIVGLPDTAVKESEDRVLSAMMNTGLRTHETKTTVNLAPGDLRKEGAMYDLPIAVGMAAATSQIPKDKLPHYLIAGELGLSGGTRAVKGGVAIAMLAKRLGLKGVILPRPSAEEAALVTLSPPAASGQPVPAHGADRGTRFR
jgi:magnesium chelatase family protein